MIYISLPFASMLSVSAPKRSGNGLLCYHTEHLCVPIPYRELLGLTVPRQQVIDKVNTSTHCVCECGDFYSGAFYSAVFLCTTLGGPCLAAVHCLHK